MDNGNVGMTYERYIDTNLQMGLAVDFDKAPPRYEDFPSYVHTAIDIYNLLPDTYSGGMESIYSGKNLASLQVLLDIKLVDREDYQYILDVLTFLDDRARRKAISDAEKRNKKNASKSKK